MFARADVCDDQRRVDVRGHRGIAARGGNKSMIHTDFSRELEQLGRFLVPVSGRRLQAQDRLQGESLPFEPKPQEPTKHQYDFDVATVAGFLRRFEPRARGQAQHRSRPRRARASLLRARGRARRLARTPRFGRRQPQRLPVRLGHRPVPQQRARTRAGALFHPQAGRHRPGRLQLRLEGAPPVDRSGRSVARPYRRHRRLRRGFGRGGENDRGRQVRRAERRAVLPLERAERAGDAEAGREFWRRSPSTSPTRRSIRSRVRGGRSCSRTCSTVISDGGGQGGLLSPILRLLRGGVTARAVVDCGPCGLACAIAISTMREKLILAALTNS